MRIVVVDPFDSFVYILRQYLMAAGADPVVVRADEASPQAVAALAPEGILLGPGPGHPAESGHVELVRELGARIPILGVCLGHQAIGLAFGASVVPAQRLMHGKTSRLTHDGEGVFAGVLPGVQVTRYHSLIVVEDTVPDCLMTTARSDHDGYVMGLRHRELPIDSVQFHPESVCTEQGLLMIQNYLRGVEAFRTHGRHRVVRSGRPVLPVSVG